MNVKTITPVELAFGGNLERLMPPINEYQEYRKNWFYGKSWGFKLFNDLFHLGLTKLEFVPKEGIDANAAFTHIRALMASWESKHEDKTAACAYLFEHWFESATWETKKKS